MPVDTGHGRHGRQREFSGPSVWKCPGCGAENVSDPAKVGCTACHAGDPGKSQAGQAGRPGDPHNLVQHEPVVDALLTRLKQPGQPITVQAPTRMVPDGLTKVYRLIEYLIPAGAEAQLQATLRRSLVGTLTMGDLTMTATVVDSLDTNQQDRLRLAKLQPGVWLANPTAMHEVGGFDSRRASAAPENPTGGGESGVAPRPRTTTYRQYAPGAETMTTPPTGPAFSPLAGTIAQSIVVIGGLRLAHTLALALQALLPELEQNAEPEKFLSYQDALELASALMHQVPEGWEGDANPTPLQPLTAPQVLTDTSLPMAEPPPAPTGAYQAARKEPTPEERAEARERALGVGRAAAPTAVPWQAPTTRGGQ